MGIHNVQQTRHCRGTDFGRDVDHANSVSCEAAWQPSQCWIVGTKTEKEVGTSWIL